MTRRCWSAWSRRDGRRPPELLPRHGRAARGERVTTCARPLAAPAARWPCCRTCRARSLDRRAHATGSRLKPARRCRDVRVRRERRRRQRPPDVHHLGRLADTVDAGEIMYLADGAVRLRVSDAPADGEIDADRRGRRHRRLAPGPQHPGRDRPRCRPCPRRTSTTCAPASGSASTSSRSRSCAAPRTTFLRKHTRLPLIAKIEKPQAVQRGGDRARPTA